MTLLEAKESLHSIGYCDFDLKDFNEDFYNQFLEIKYKNSDKNYLDNFICIRFDYHSDVYNNHSQNREIVENFEQANKRVQEILKEYDYEYIAQLWLQSQSTPNFNHIYYSILEHFYGQTEKDVKFGLQWTCYSENCFLKDHNDGQGDEYQNTCAILIYLNEEWEEEWGGNLVLRNTKNANDRNKTTQYKVVPKFGKVAIIDLATFDTAHAVEDVIGDHKRCTLLGFATGREKKQPKIL